MTREFAAGRMRLLWIAAALACCLQSLAAQSGSPAHATAPELARLDAYFAKALSDWKVPGLSVAIVKDGNVIFAKGYGVRELGKPDRVDEQTLFAIASNTKAFTAAAVAHLVDDKKLTWDDRIVQHVPSFRLADAYVTAETRLRDVLSHRTGFRTFSGDLVWYGTPYSREEVIRRARFLDLSGPFRAHYGYSNIAFLVAGEVVEAVSGKSWDDYVRETFFAPLGMTRTVTSVRDLQQTGNVATPHAAFDEPLRAFAWYNWDTMGPAGGIISSAADMAKWLRLQLNRGTIDGRTYFSDAASRQMWTPHISFPIGREAAERTPTTHFRSYGLGWFVSDYRGRLVADHSGGADGMFSYVSLVPDEKLGVVVLTNSDTSVGSALASRVVDVYTGAPERDWSAEGLARAERTRKQQAEERKKVEESRVPNTRPSLPLDAYAGTYPSDLFGDAVVTVENGRLVLRLTPNPDMVADLSHWHFDTFALTWRKPFPWFGRGRVQFVLDRDAKVSEVKLDVPNNDFWFWEPRFVRQAR